jgi:transcriptional regulatory protein LevR
MGYLNKAIINANRSALNKVIAKAKTAASRAVREVYNIKARDLNKEIKIRRATNSNLRAILSLKTRRTSLTKFSPRRVKINKRFGVKVKIKRKEPPKLVKGAFMADVRNKTNIFKRVGKKRFPIKKLFTLSVAEMFEREGEKALQNLIKNELAAIHKRELQYYIKK